MATFDGFFRLWLLTLCEGGDRCGRDGKATDGCFFRFFFFFESGRCGSSTVAILSEEEVGEGNDGVVVGGEVVETRYSIATATLVSERFDDQIRWLSLS
jgi:hypothetical protein